MTIVQPPESLEPNGRGLAIFHLERGRNLDTTTDAACNGAVIFMKAENAFSRFTFDRITLQVIEHMTLTALPQSSPSLRRYRVMAR